MQDSDFRLPRLQNRDQFLSLISHATHEAWPEQSKWTETGHYHPESPTGAQTPTEKLACATPRETPLYFCPHIIPEASLKSPVRHVTCRDDRYQGRGWLLRTNKWGLNSQARACPCHAWPVTGLSLAQAAGPPRTKLKAVTLVVKLPWEASSRK